MSKTINIIISLIIVSVMFAISIASDDRQPVTITEVPSNNNKFEYPKQQHTGHHHEGSGSMSMGVDSSEDDSKHEWKVPSSWKRSAGNRFIMSAYTGVYEDVLVRTTFSISSGTLLENVNRWERQLALPESAQDELTGLVKLRQGQLSYQYVYVMSPDQTGKAFLAALFKEGDSLLVIKTEIPDVSIVSKVEGDFFAMCDGVVLK